MASPTLQFKRGLFVNLPALRAGEPGFTTDRSDLYIGIGAGTTASNQFYGSSRYWKREVAATSAAELKLVDAAGNDGVSLRSPVSAGAGVTYTLPGPGGSTGHYLKLGTDGALEWASVSEGASFTNATLTNTSFSGISTFSGAIDANAGLDVTGGSTFDNINVTGVGTIATADINGGNIDGTVIGASSAAAGTFTQLNYSNSSTSGISTVGSLYVGTTKVLSTEGGLVALSGIATLDATTKATLEATLKLDPNDFDTLNVTGISTIGGLLDANGGLDVTGQTTLNTGLNVTSGVSTFAGLVDANAGLDVTGQAVLNNDLAVTGVSTFTGLVDANGGLDVTGQAVLNNDLAVTGVSTFTGAITANGNVTLGDNSSDTLTVNANATFLGTLTGTISTATRSTQVDTTATSDDVSYYVPFVANSSSTTSETVRVDAGISYNPSSNTLDVPNLETASIKHTNGTSSITIDTLGNVGVATNLTVTGNLNVLGSTTTVNTETLLVKDSLIEVGLVDSAGALVPPSTDANIDAGMVFHYYDASAKKAAVYWDDSAGRVKVATQVTESNNVLTAVANGALEIGGLYVAGCAGSPVEVIGCVNGEVTITNAVIDGGVWG